MPGPVGGHFLDLPLAADAADTGARLVAVAAPWPGAVDLWRVAPGGGLTRLGTQRRPGLAGVTVTPLAAGAAGYWQRRGVEVEMIDERLFSVSTLDVLGGANTLALESVTGDWEILQFRDAALVGPHRYRLSHLLRGQRGGEALAALAVPAGSRVVLLDAAVQALPVGVEDLGVATDYVFGDARRPPDHADHARATVVPEGRGLVPFAPAHLRLSRQGGDHVFGWIRRTRIGGDAWFGADVPLGEEREAYRVEIWAGGTLRRAGTVTAPAFVYGAAMRAADGVSGPYEMRVAQLSVAMGPGKWRSIDVDG